MAADKHMLQPQCGNLFMDTGFDTSHIGENTVFWENSGEPAQIFGIIGNRCAEKEDVAAGKSIARCLTDDIGDSVFLCLQQGITVCIIGLYGYLFSFFFQGSGNGAADQAQADKAAGDCIHGMLFLSCRYRGNTAGGCFLYLLYSE